MNQEERLDYLIEELCKESRKNQHMKPRQADKRMVLRALMNQRMPQKISEKYLQVQDDFLKQELAGQNITLEHEIPTLDKQFGSKHRHANRMSLWKGDITRLKVDAIVNAANSQMLGCFAPCHGCIDNAIHSAAGLQLREECSRIMQAQGRPEPTGQAKLTGAYNLPAKYVLHTVGPIVYGQLTEEDCRMLQACYDACMVLAEEHQLKTIAFCCISTGEFHFPNKRAAEIAVSTVSRHLDHAVHLERIIFNVFKDIDYQIYENFLTSEYEIQY